MKKQGYAIRSYTRQLRYRDQAPILKTREMFDAILAFYFERLRACPELIALSNQKALRQLEVMTIPVKNGPPVPTPLPWQGVPLYFRRAAINTALSLYRSAVSREENSMPDAKSLRGKMVYYKGMYRGLDDRHIEMKWFDGEKWFWEKHRHTGRDFPEDSQIMSPTVSIKGKAVLLQFSVKIPVADARNIRERVQDGASFCAVALTGGDSLAVCTMMDAAGQVSVPYFIKGGDFLKHRRKLLLDAVNFAHKSARDQALLEKVKRLNDDAAQRVSREIVDYAQNHGARIIVVPDLSESLEKNRQYFIKGSPWAFIGRRIVRYAKEKAWQAGIVVAERRPYYASNYCYYCGEKVKKCNAPGEIPKENLYGGKNIVCPNGHQGSAALNMARNMARAFYEKNYQAASSENKI